MPDETESQTYETGRGVAEQVDDDDRSYELELPPALAEGIEKLEAADKRIRKLWKPTSKEGQELKRLLTNHVLDAVNDLFRLYGQAFMETYQFTAQVNGQHRQAIEHILRRMRAAGIDVGVVPASGEGLAEEQIPVVRAALADLALLVADKHGGDDELNDALERVSAALSSLLGAVDDEDDGDPDDDDGGEGDDEPPDDDASADEEKGSEEA